MSPCILQILHEPRNVLITGGCGFIGSNFINYMHEKWTEAKFINLDKLAVGASPENISLHIQQGDRYLFIQGNLLDQKLVQETLIQHKVMNCLICKKYYWSFFQKKIDYIFVLF